jgi:hypothetical protein
VKSLHAKIGELTLENDSDQFGQTSPKIKGRKRHLLADTAGFLIAGIVMKPAYKIATAHPRFSS